MLCLRSKSKRPVVFKVYVWSYWQVYFGHPDCLAQNWYIAVKMYLTYPLTVTNQRLVWQVFPAYWFETSVDIRDISPLSFNPTKWSATLSDVADELFDCGWPFCEAGASRFRVASLRKFEPKDSNQLMHKWPITSFGVSIVHWKFSGRLVGHFMWEYSNSVIF